MDTISRFPGMTKEASDAFSSFTQVRLTGAPRLLRFPEADCVEMRIGTAPRQIPMSWAHLTIHGSSGKAFTRSLLPAGLLWEIKSEDVLLKNQWRKDMYIGMSLRAQKARVFVFGLHGRTKNRWEKARPQSHVDNLQRDSGREDPTPFEDQVYFRCTQSEAKVDYQAVQAGTKDKRNQFVKKRSRLGAMT